ncbi:MAG: hypothetical protein ACRD5G_16525 [Candidatus Acidiferrales bacterium]
MFGIRNSPFVRDEDAADFMIEILDQEAAKEGDPLSQKEKALLRDEFERSTVSHEFHFRAQRLVDAVLKKEQETGQAKLPRSFNCAVEWAGDQEYPYVVWLAENAFGQVRRPLRGWAAAKDALLCIGCGVFIVAAMLLIVGLLGLMGFLR